MKNPDNTNPDNKNQIQNNIILILNIENDVSCILDDYLAFY